jgi:chromosome segregation ATPase
MPTAYGNLSALLNVDYQPPSQNFDRGLVKGRVIRLINLREERYAVALEQAAGENLFSVIVENEVTCGVLIKGKCFLR